jgi:cyclohexanone monooxygenase
VVQRTPVGVDFRHNKETDVEWWKEITKEKGWQKKRDYCFQAGVLGVPVDIEVDDGFSMSSREIMSLIKDNAETGRGSEYTMAEMLQLADFKLMERIRKRIDDEVKDKKTAELLKPWCGCPVSVLGAGSWKLTQSFGILGSMAIATCKQR